MQFVGNKNSAVETSPPALEQHGAVDTVVLYWYRKEEKEVQQTNGR